MYVYISHVRRRQAYCRSAGDGRWRLFDDSSVTAVPAGDEAAALVTPAAYVLFYRLRHA